MSIKRFHSLIKTENKAFRYLIKAFWEYYQKFCIRSKSRKIYRLKGIRYRCKRGCYTYSNFTGRWIGMLNIKPIQWLWVIKFFELELSTRKIAREVGISYPTALRATNIIRESILTQSKDGQRLLKSEIEADWIEKALFGL